MTHARAMLDTHPRPFNVDEATLANTIEMLIDCANTCTQCADACLAEGDPALAKCIRLNLDCADICNITGRIATRRTGSDEEMIRRMLHSCAAACRLCADECEKHAKMHEHCRICAESCRRCMSACEDAGRGMAH